MRLLSMDDVRGRLMVDWVRILEPNTHPSAEGNFRGLQVGIFTRGVFVVFGATAVSLTVFGAGTAAADNYAGQTYADASSALSKANLKGVVAARVGDAVPQDQCTVTRSEKTPWIKGDHFKPVSDTVLLYLNCNAAVASATTPGNSAESPEGRVAKHNQETGDYINAHPEYCVDNPGDCQAFKKAHPELF